MAPGASLHPIPLPHIAHRRRCGGSNVVDDDNDDDDANDTSIRGWDHSIIADLPPPSSRRTQPSRVAGENSLGNNTRTATFHAVAHGNTVVGTSSSLHNGDAENNIRWQTSLNSTVVTVASNSNGSVIAAATSTEVSLLKGCDGSVLATRQIAPKSDYGEGEAGSSFPPQLLFLSNNNNSSADNDIDDCCGRDLLAVVCPVNKQQQQSNVILIGNIDGQLLNSTNNQEVREGAASMSMEALPLLTEDSGRNCESVVKRMEGAFVNANTVRFFVQYQNDDNGHRENAHDERKSPILSVVDYNISEKKSNMVLDNLGDHLKSDFLLGWNDRNSTITSLVGMGIDSYCSPTLGTFLLVACSPQDGTTSNINATTNDTATIGTSSISIAWINILDLSISARYNLPSNTSLLSCTPVQSHDVESCVATAVACSKGSSSKTDIFVVQSKVTPKKGDGVKNAMVLFSVDVMENTDDISLCAPSALDTRGAYVFRYLSKSSVDDDASSKCLEFVANEQVQLGVLHTHLSNNGFEEAHALADHMSKYSLSEEGSYCDDYGRISTPMTKSYISLLQFQHVLSQQSLEENKVEAKECLRRIAKGVILSGGGNNEIDCMVAAAQFLMGWPANQAIQGGDDLNSTMVSIQEVSIALLAMSTAIKGVVEVIGSSKSTSLEEQRRKLDERTMALKALASIVPSLHDSQVIIDDPFLAVDSIVGLLHALVSHGAFKSVQLLQTSEYGKNALLSYPDTIASAALRIPLTVDPRSYIPWLTDVVMPSLAIGHPLLERIRSWVCGAADRYDENDVVRGIDSSILLLTAVSRATARLTVAMNNCFTYPMQLELDNDKGCNDPITPRNNQAISSSSFCTSFDSNASVRSTRSSRPTVLNIGMISGMKKRDGRMLLSAQRVNRGNNNGSNNTSLDFSFFNNPSPTSIAEDASFVEEDDEDGDCVEYKLNEAVRLKTARGLGLERDVLTLANYSSKGEQYILKELVKAALRLNRYSSESSDHALDIVDEIRSFAVDVDADADFDEAVQQLANELCDNNRDDIPHVLRQSQILVQWCTTPSVKCTIVLKMLRIALVSVQRPPDLTSLAKEAIGMSVDEHLKSELVEAFRLLGIDLLVRRYCGNGAQEFFRVSDPSHTGRLVQHVCRHIEVPTVLTDVLMLCEAFTHVSKLDTCVSILQRLMLAPSSTQTLGDASPSKRTEQCVSSMREIYSKDAILAERVGERMAGFCAGVLEDCVKMISRETFPEEAKRQAMLASSTACAVLSVMQDHAVIGRRAVSSNAGSLGPTLLKEFQKISKLQSGCGIYLTLEGLRDPSSRALVVSDLLQASADLLLSRKSLLEMEDDSLRNELKPLVATARQWCAILCDSPLQVSQIWSRAIGSAASQVAKISTDHASLLLLEVSGLLDERNGHSSYHAIMSVALTLCARAFSEARHLSRSMSLISQDETDVHASFIAMRSMAQASHLLREHILLQSPSSMLSSSLSLGNLTELVCEILTRSDMGIGERLERYVDMLQSASRRYRQQSYNLHEKSNNMLADKCVPSAPNLHPTWYIGDGLNLPPLEALFLVTSYCNMILDIESKSPSKSDLEPNNSLMEKSEIVRSLESRGAHTASLRLLMVSMATSASQSSSSSSMSLMFPNTENILKKNNCVLAERSLGGTESGLTSGNIDALMSVSFLLHLPKEMAFKIYQAALPSAIGKRDFPRILTLASIGTFCGIGTFSCGERFHWSKQQRFIDQCDELSCNVIWWSVLSHYRVSFDPSVFSQTGDAKSSVEETLQSYCEKLVWNASKKLGPRSTLILSRRFMKDYGLNKHVPASALIEFLLSAPDDETNGEVAESKPEEFHGSSLVFDIRHDLNQTESAVKECLALLPTLNRNVVLRKAIMKLEKDQRCAKDYDRHAMVLQLYRECLNKLRGVMKKSDARAKAHEEETGRIGRRQDALVIISSIFEKYPAEKKPEYLKLFEPLPRDPLHPGKDVRKFSVLGVDAAEHIFDPLAPLDGVLEDENGSNSIVAALAPLCSLLQLPSGYLHARSMVVRFRKLKASGSLLPPFDTAVAPVAKKLKTSRDRADLAWWCSLIYVAGSVQQLKCLDMAHKNATDASEEAESSKDLEEESIALERVKRIDAARAGLSDKILVDEVLKLHESTTKTVKVLYKSIIDKVQQRAQSEENYCPEHLVQALLIEGSLTAAVASLDDADGFATHHFRMLALLVHDACKSLSNRYSHVNVGKCARLLTRRWLVHGCEGEDESEGGFTADLHDGNAEEAENNEGQTRAEVKPDDENEDTSEFVMDMGIISSGKQNWSNDSKNNDGINGEITSSEEPSALSPSSLRELSDHLCSRVALRIAFLICFAEDYHRLIESSPEKGTNENVDGNVAFTRQTMRPKSKLAQKPRQKTNCFEGDLALQHARELLGIVFARQGSTIASTYEFLFDESSAYDESILSSVPENTAKEEYHTKSKALSFAMRHRALRVATILVPREVITRVVVEETYFDDDHLNKCAFGSFVAMEIEAMGLPLPHSDLVQLSAMHFPSYARTIWRNHGTSSSSRGFSGRLHLLLLELCVNHHDTVDWEMFMLIFSELERLELPRSLLLACECAVQSRAVALASSQNRLDVLQSIEDATKKIAELIVREVETNLGAGIEFNASVLSTLHRLVAVVNSEDMHADPSCFVQAFSDLSNQCVGQGENTAGNVFMNAAIQITNHLTDPEVFGKTSSIVGSRDALDENFIEFIYPSPTCARFIQNFEHGFH